MRLELKTALFAAMLAAPSVALAAPTLHAVPNGARTSMVEKAKCWWRQGRRYCSRAHYDGYPRYGYRAYGYGPGYYYRWGRPRPEDFPTGSTQWWRSMDREGRGGFRR